MIAHYLRALLAAHREHIARCGDPDDAPPMFSPLEYAVMTLLAGMAVCLIGVGKFCGWWL